MKIGLVVTKHGYSFVNQAEALLKGLRLNGAEAEIVSNETDLKIWDVVLGVGSWQNYDELITKPVLSGAKAIVPWMVSDGKIENHVNELNKLGFLLTPSERCRQEFVRDGVRPDIIRVLPEAVDNDFWKTLPDEEVAGGLEMLSIKNETQEMPLKFNLFKARQTGIPVLFTTGGDATSKGALEVIGALGQIYRDTGNTNWLYLIKTWPAAGSFLRSAAELDLAEKLGIWENIKYVVGEYSAEFLRILMNTADIYAAPSRGEGFGLPLVEAAMCGKPVITCEGTAAGETVEHGITGYISKAIVTDDDGPKADINELASYLQILISDKDKRQQMGEAGRQRAIAKYSPMGVAKQLLKMLNIDK